MAARLAAALVVLGLAVLFVGPGEGAQEAARGLYGTIAVAFLATVMFAAVLPLVRNVPPYAALQIGVDLALVTSVVLFSGGARSIFSFLYLPIVVLGSILFQRRGGYLAACAASLGFALVVDVAPPSPFDGRAPDAMEVKLAIWGVHTGALLLVALLSSTLSRELRAADENLRASRSELYRLEALHERTVECLTSGLVTADDHGLVTSCNPEGEHILQRQASELLGLTLDEISEGLGELAERGLAVGRARTRLRRIDGDGRVQYLGVGVSGRRGENGEPDGHVLIFQDVTEVVELEAQLQRSARLAGVGELAASIAHEIRNPLAAISGSVEMLDAEAPAEERTQLMTIVLREISRLDGLIGDFLVYARPAAPKRVAMRLAPVVEHVVKVARGEGTTIHCDIPDELLIEADPDQLEQVLWNLIRNAIQALDGSGEVILSARAIAPESQATSRSDRRTGEEGRRLVEIAVSDTGIGIEPETLERIFDPFFTTKRKGSGLGLSTVHRILEAHRATIQVESHPGEGTTFLLQFPTPTDSPLQEPA